MKLVRPFTLVLVSAALAVQVHGQSLTLDSLIGNLSARLDPIETYRADTRIFECG